MSHAENEVEDMGTDDDVPFETGGVPKAILDSLASLPETLRSKAEDMVSLMFSTIDGVGDTPQKWIPPYLRVVQATSDRSRLPKGATVGTLLIGDTIIDAPKRIIPIMIFGTKAYWNPDQTQSSMICRSPNGELGSTGQPCKTCVFGKFDKASGTKSACSSVHNALVVSEDLSEIFYVQFAKTAYAEGSNLKKMMQAAGGSYMRSYDLLTQTHPVYKNVENLTARPAQPTDKEIRPFLSVLYNHLKNDRNKYLADYTLAIKSKVAEQGILFDGIPYEDAVANAKGKAVEEESDDTIEVKTKEASKTPKKNYAI